MPTRWNVKALTFLGVSTLIGVLAYGSQLLFLTEPPLLPAGSTSYSEFLIFNILIFCIYGSYAAAILTPAAYANEKERALPHSASPAPSSTRVEPAQSTAVERASTPPNSNKNTISPDTSPDFPPAIRVRAATVTQLPLYPYTPPRHCTKCALPKPPRTHHCKTCGSCIPKMDHHCRWIGQCVSFRNFPPFIRFLVYANLGLAMNGMFHFRAWRGIWALRHVSHWRGPGAGQMIALLLLSVGNAVVGFALGLLLIKIGWGWAANQTAIEGWTVERHRAVRRRAWVNKEGRGRGFLVLPGGRAEVKVEKVEFPYDVGIMRNLSNAMGGGWNLLWWIWPLAGGLSLGSKEMRGLVSERNVDIFGEWDEWPPVDPEKMGWWGTAAEKSESWRNPPMRSDMKDDGVWSEGVRRRAKQDQENTSKWMAYADQQLKGTVKEPPWTNSDGDRLEDFGVDEDTEQYSQADYIKSAQPPQSNGKKHYNRTGDDETLSADDDLPLAQVVLRKCRPPLQS